MLIVLCFEQGLFQCSWLISRWTKWVRGITVAKLCRYFISKQKGSTADSYCKILHTRKQKIKKLLFMYVNSVVKTSWLWYNENYNLISVKTCSKEEQCSRPTLNEIKDEQIRRTTISDFTLLRWSTNNAIAPRLKSRKNRSQLAWGGMRPQKGMNRKCPCLTFDFNYIPYIPYIRSGRLMNLAKSSQGQTI